MNILYFVQTDITVILILTIIRYQMRQQSGSHSSAEMIFDRMLMAVVVMSFADMVAGILDGIVFPYSNIIMEVADVLYYEMITLISFMWMIYVLVRLGKINSLRDKHVILWAAPLIIMTVLLLSNHSNHFIFYIDAMNVYHRGPYVYLHWILSWPYLLIITAILFKRVFIEKNRVKMSEAKVLLLFIIAPAISNILQMFISGISVSQVGMVVSILVIYIASLKRQIQRDELTGLNNNRAFRLYLADKVYKEQEPVNMTVLMIDIDNFKNINDTYGHIEGDKALIAVAKMLKSICGRVEFSPFLCRYAGDEFVIAVVDIKNSEICSLIDMINEGMTKISKDMSVPCTITLSIGYSSIKCSNNDDVNALIRDADEKMYLEKKFKKVSK